MWLLIFIDLLYKISILPWYNPPELWVGLCIPPVLLLPGGAGGVHHARLELPLLVGVEGFQLRGLQSKSIQLIFFANFTE
jgi:hypothetical protein